MKRAAVAVLGVTVGLLALIVLPQIVEGARQARARWQAIPHTSDDAGDLKNIGITMATACALAMVLDNARGRGYLLDVVGGW